MPSTSASTTDNQPDHFARKPLRKLVTTEAARISSSTTSSQFIAPCR